MNCKLKIILFILLLVGGENLMATTFDVSGSVSNNGVSARYAEVHMQTTGLDTNFITDSVGQFRVTVSTTRSVGLLRVFFLDCKSDTIENWKAYISSTSLLITNLKGCPSFVSLTGTVSNYQDAPRFSDIYFSLDNFKTLRGSTKMGIGGWYVFVFIPVKSGVLYTRIRDCMNNWYVDSVPFNLRDTVRRTLNYCKPNPGNYFGNIKLNGRSISDTSAIVLRYKYLPNLQKFDFEDTIDVRANGSFQFPNDGVYDYQLKVLPKSPLEKFAATYYPNGLFWNKSNSKAIGSHIKRSLKIDLINTDTALGTYKIEGKVEIDRKFVKPGYAAVGILLLGENDKVIDYTYANTSNTFLFENLAAGKYKVWIDQCGLPTIVKSIEVNAMNPHVNNMVITANNNGVSYDEFVGNQEVIIDQEIRIFPNPFVDFLKFELPEPTAFVIKDILGKIVFSGLSDQEQTFLVSTNNWPTGLYLIMFQTKKELYIKKMIKK